VAGKKKMFKDRVEEAKVFVEEGNLKKAISTLNKAIDNEPEKDVDDKINNWIKELELIEDDNPLGKELEVISFRVTAPFLRNGVCFEVGNTINLPSKNNQANIEPME